MNNLKSRDFNPDSVEGEYNLVAMWSKVRPRRLLAGVLAGIVAGLAMVLFGVIYCAMTGQDITAPMKIAALPFLGENALQIGSMKAIVVGLVAHLSVSSFLGAYYAHFTGVNNKKALFGMGLTWGIWGWIFITCLMMPSFRAYHAAQIPQGIMFFAWLVFGVSLMSVSFFDSAETNSKK
jgi:hypothetical protein